MACTNHGTVVTTVGLCAQVWLGLLVLKLKCPFCFLVLQPPENALQGLQGRVLSEHELRVQRSLQQLNVPDWYKNSARPAEGFLLKRGSDAGSVTGSGPGRRGAGGWPGLGVKTTSLSSLRSPTAGKHAKRCKLVGVTLLGGGVLGRGDPGEGTAGTA